MVATDRGADRGAPPRFSDTLAASGASARALLRAPAMNRPSLVYRTLLSSLVASAVAAAGAACDQPPEAGGDGAPSDGGATGRTDGAVGEAGADGPRYSDCGPLKVRERVVLSDKCEPQLRATTAYSEYSSCGAVTCAWTVELPCGAAAWLANASRDRAEGDGGREAGPDSGPGLEPLTDCEVACRAAGVPDRVGCGVDEPFDDAGGTYKVTCGGCGVGRPPRSFVAAACSAPSVEGEWLARAAQLEAASVIAFRALGRDLARWGAPRDLVAAVEVAAEDEERHARVVRELARRQGAVVPEIDVRVPRRRTLEQLAMENGAEGCVTELFGVVLATIQSERGTDSRVRRAMAAIAADELEHAALSLRIAAWLEDQLDEAARARVASARRSAWRSLDRDLARGGAAIDALGLPDARAAQRALRTLIAGLSASELAPLAA